MTRQQAGKLGGLATLKKHGREHMRNIGKLGAAKTWELYYLSPKGTSDFWMVRKSDNKPIATLSGQWRM